MSADMREPGGTRAGGVFAGDCPARTVLDHVTNRWGVLILVALRERPLRFCEVRDRVGGISEKMLSQNLRLLTADGLVAREVQPLVPVRVSYGLTPVGRELAETLRGTIDVIEARLPEILLAREAHANATGAASPAPAPGTAPGRRAAAGATRPGPPRSAA